MTGNHGIAIDDLVSEEAEIAILSNSDHFLDADNIQNFQNNIGFDLDVVDMEIIQDNWDALQESVARQQEYGSQWEWHVISEADRVAALENRERDLFVRDTLMQSGQSKRNRQNQANDTALLLGHAQRYWAQREADRITASIEFAGAFEIRTNGQTDTQSIHVKLEDVADYTDQQIYQQLADIGVQGLDGAIVFTIHGWNTSEEDKYEGGEQWQQYFENAYSASLYPAPVVINVQWDSAAPVSLLMNQYRTPQGHSLSIAQQQARLVNSVDNQNPDASINVVAHSMGTLVALESLGTLKIKLTV